jgi:signal transduction histidine kinase
MQTQAPTGKEKELLQMEQKIAEENLSNEERFNLFDNLITTYKTRDTEKTKFYFDKAIRIAKEKKDIEWETRYLTHIGDIYTDWGNKDSARICLNKALRLIEGREYYQTESLVHETQGNYYLYVNELENAMVHFLKAMELNKKDRSHKIANKKDITSTFEREVACISNISGVYYVMNNYEKVIENMLVAKKIIDDNPKIDLRDIEQRLLANLAGIYNTVREPQKALPLLERAYTIAVEKEDYTVMAFTLNSLSSYYREVNNVDKALDYAKQALQAAEKSNEPYILNVADRGLLHTYFMMKNYKTALFYAERILSRTEEPLFEELGTVWGRLILIYAALGDLESSEEYFLKYRDLYEKKSSENLHNALQEMEVKYEVEQKELEHQAEISRQKNRQHIYVGGLSVAGLLLALLAIIIVQRTKRNRELVEMNATKDKFFTIISHDLKNPTIAQRDALQMLIDFSNDWDTALLSKYYYELLKSADSQVELLYNLLNWAQVQTKRMPYRPMQIDLVTTLRSDIILIKNMAERKGIIFDISIPEIVIITGDNNMLATAVRNLLTNAVKFTNTGGTVTLKISPCVNETQYVVSVSDTGIGMTPEQIQNLFHIDRRQFKTGTAGERGSGLGLAVCKELIEKHGSILYIESVEGEGSKFWFKIS